MNVDVDVLDSLKRSQRGRNGGVNDLLSPAELSLQVLGIFNNAPIPSIIYMQVDVSSVTVVLFPQAVGRGRSMGQAEGVPGGGADGSV